MTQKVGDKKQFAWAYQHFFDGYKISKSYKLRYFILFFYIIVGIFKVKYIKI